MTAGTADVLAVDWSKIHWGDFPTWVAGVLTGLAVLVTGIGLLAEAVRSSKERADRVAAEDRGQAELVAAWQDHLSLDPQDYADALQGWRGDQPEDTSAVGAVVFIRIRNASQLPVYGLSYRVEAGVRGTFVGAVAVLPPETVAEVAIPLHREPRSEGSPPEIAFSDTRNKRWKRSSTGVLAEYDDTAFEPRAGAYPSVDEHPTLRLPHPVRFGTLAYSDATGQLVRPRPPQLW